MRTTFLQHKFRFQAILPPSNVLLEGHILMAYTLSEESHARRFARFNKLGAF